MSISCSDREDFVRFMRQHDWMKQFRFDATIYSIETEWFKPYHTIFYIGVTQNIERRKKEHTEDVDNTLKEYTPDDFYEALSAGEKLMELGTEGCSKLRKGVIAACVSSGYTLTFSELATIHVRDYEQDTATLSVMESIEVAVGRKKSRFSSEVLEKEYRWIFKKFQEGYNLTNAERFYEQMIRELRYRPHFDVLNTPFSSSAWNPIIEAYLKDRQVVEPYLK